MWQRLVEPVAEHVVSAMGNALPEEAQAMAGPLMGILNQAGGAMFGTQVGQALGGLAGEVLTASDIGLPLGPSGKAALLPANVSAFADGLDVGEEDVRLYLALREAAHQRLFAHVPWLRAHLLATVEDYGRGTTIDVSKIEESMRGIDPTNPASLQEALEGGLFEPEKTPAQQAALTRLETILALVEGWVDDVVGQATESRMPAAGKLQEAVRRRRAAGGPAESTFAALVGLELRPRRLRDASALWGSLRSRQGQQGRDAVWAHPDLLPTADDLDDPLGFREGLAEPEALTDAEFDAALAQTARHGGRRPGDGAGGRRHRRRRHRDGRRRHRRHPAGVTTGHLLHDDALTALRGWGAPSPEQEDLRARYVAHLERHPDGTDRSCFPDHLTAGTLMLSADGDAVLLNLHGKARRWFAFGGHIEPGDQTLARRGAAGGRRGVRARRLRARPGARPPRPAHGRRSATRGGMCGTWTSATRRWRRTARPTRSVPSPSTCAGGLSTRCPRSRRRCTR